MAQGRASAAAFFAAVVDRLVLKKIFKQILDEMGRLAHRVGKVERQVVVKLIVHGQGFALVACERVLDLASKVGRDRAGHNETTALVVVNRRGDHWGRSINCIRQTLGR